MYFFEVTIFSPRLKTHEGVLKIIEVSFNFFTCRRKIKKMDVKTDFRKLNLPE
jgi:hypothetical protein